MFSVQSSENSPCAVFGDGAFCERVESKRQPSDWCCPQESPFTCLQFKYSPTYFFILFFFQVLGLSCAVARRIQTATLTWTWMGTTHLNTGNHSIVFWKALTEREPRGAPSASSHTVLLWVVLDNVSSCTGNGTTFPSYHVIWPNGDSQLLPLRAFCWCSTNSDPVGEVCMRLCRRWKLLFPLISVS